MNMRDRLREAAECGIRRTDYGEVYDVYTDEIVDAVLDALTANPGHDVLAAGIDSMNNRLGTADSDANQNQLIVSNIFQAMLRAIKEGK